MASERAGNAWQSPRMVAAFVWIFGCAAYYYVRFTWHFINEHEEAMRELLSRLAEVFALSRRAG